MGPVDRPPVLLGGLDEFDGHGEARGSGAGALRFVDNTNRVVIMGPVGVGKTFLATALG